MSAEAPTNAQAELAANAELEYACLRPAALRPTALRCGPATPARAALAAVPGAEDLLRADGRKEVSFYARWGLTQAQLRHRVSEPHGVDMEPLPSFQDGLAELRAREAATFPSGEGWS